MSRWAADFIDIDPNATLPAPGAAEEECLSNILVSAQNEQLGRGWHLLVPGALAIVLLLTTVVVKRWIATSPTEITGTIVTRDVRFVTSTDVALVPSFADAIRGLQSTHTRVRIAPCPFGIDKPACELAARGREPVGLFELSAPRSEQPMTLDELRVPYHKSGTRPCAVSVRAHTMTSDELALEVTPTPSCVPAATALFPGSPELRFGHRTLNVEGLAETADAAEAMIKVSRVDWEFADGPGDITLTSKRDFNGPVWQSLPVNEVTAVLDSESKLEAGEKLTCTPAAGLTATLRGDGMKAKSVSFDATTGVIRLVVGGITGAAVGGVTCARSYDGVAPLVTLLGFFFTLGMFVWELGRRR